MNVASRVRNAVAADARHADAFTQRHGVAPDICSPAYANLWLRQPSLRLPVPDLRLWYREPGLYLPLSCAIAFDTVSAGVLSTPSNPHTVGAGANRVLVAFGFDDTGGSNLTSGIAWNTSEGLTKIRQVQVPGDRWISMWYLLAPSSGTHDITVTSGAGAFRYSAISLSGVGALDTSNSNTASSSNPLACSLTAAANCWLVSGIKANGAVTFDSWSNITEDATAAGNGISMGTSRGNVSGAITSTASYAAFALTWGVVMATFTTAGAGPSTTAGDLLADEIIKSLIGSGLVN